jgi:hypothetical protein
MAACHRVVRANRGHGVRLLQNVIALGGRRAKVATNERFRRLGLAVSRNGRGRMSPYRTITLITGLAVIAVPLGVGDAAGARPRHDRRPPTPPTGLTVSNVTPTGATLTWNKSTDNVAVAGYDIYVDGKRVATTPP